MSAPSDRIRTVLDETAAWPVDAVSAGVVTMEGATVTVGEPDRVQRLASVTKPLFAYSVLIAVQDGLLHLDEPAGPDGSTVRHLLAHASGLPPEEGGPTSRVGVRRVYSNHAFEVLGDLVAERSGTTVADHLDVEVLQPLGMDATTLAGSPAHAATGTLADLLAFARELLSPTLLDDPLATDLATVQFPGLGGVLPGYGRQADNTWGLGFEIRDGKDPHWTGPSQPPTTFGHFGQSGTFLWVDRDAGAAAACLCDRDFDSWAAEVWAPFNERLWTTITDPRTGGS